MAIKFNFTPDQAGYSFRDRQETVSIALDGGLAKYRRDILGAATMVQVQWTLSESEYDYFRAFYKSITLSGSVPFLIDLAIDDAVIEEYTAYFVPESIRVISAGGLYMQVTAELEVESKDRNADEDVYKVILFNEYGEDYVTLFPPDESDIDQIINVDFAGYLNA